MKIHVILLLSVFLTNLLYPQILDILDCARSCHYSDHSTIPPLLSLSLPFFGISFLYNNEWKIRNLFCDRGRKLSIFWVGFTEISDWDCFQSFCKATIRSIGSNVECTFHLHTVLFAEIHPSDFQSCIANHSKTNPFMWEKAEL